MVSSAQAIWEETFCLPFYRNGCHDFNSIYLETQKFYARCSPAGHSVDLWGIHATTCGTNWAGLNLAFLTEPVRVVQRIRDRLARASGYYASRSLPWILVVPDLWVAPDQRESLYSDLTQQGFQLALDAHVIEAEKIEKPAQSELEILPVSTIEQWLEIAKVNAAAWDIPVEWISPLLESEPLREHAHGYLGLWNNLPVTAMVDFEVDRFNFTAFGATLSEHRGRGLAGQMMQHACASSRSGRTLLGVSSPQGLPNWVRCGFTQGPRFRLYLAPAQLST